MSAHVLLNLLNKFGKRDKMRGLPRIKCQHIKGINRGSYISAHVLLNVLNKLGKSNKM